MAGTRYRIEIDSPRHGVRGEWFVNTSINQMGKLVVNTDKTNFPDAQHGGLDRETAKHALAELRSPKFNIRCRLIDEYGNGQDDFNTTEQSAPLSLYDSHETSVYRGDFEGRTLEIPLVYNRANHTYYAKWTTSPNPNDPPDISVAGQ